MTIAEAQQHCNEWTGDFAVQCGDWARARPDPADRAPPGATGPAARRRGRADDRRHARPPGRRRRTGRVFISKNVDAEPASAVSAGRASTTTATSTRTGSSSSIYVDPANANHAWISYSGLQLEHAGDAGPRVRGRRTTRPRDTSTWVDRSYDFGDLPITDLVRDDVTGDLYASTDFGVLRLASGTTTLDGGRAGHAERRGRRPDDRARRSGTSTPPRTVSSAWRLNLG